MVMQTVLQMVKNMNVLLCGTAVYNTEYRVRVEPGAHDQQMPHVF